MTPSPNYHSATNSDHPVNWARHYAGLGWNVIPVNAVTKAPMDPQTGHGMRDWPQKATTDQATLEAWFGNHPTAGVGIATGRRSGIVVIDVDNKDDKVGELGLSLLENELGSLPSTLEAATPSARGHGARACPSTLNPRPASAQQSSSIGG